MTTMQVKVRWWTPDTTKRAAAHTRVREDLPTLRRKPEFAVLRSDEQEAFLHRMYPDLEATVTHTGTMIHCEYVPETSNAVMSAAGRASVVKTREAAWVALVVLPDGWIVEMDPRQLHEVCP